MATALPISGIEQALAPRLGRRHGARRLDASASATAASRTRGNGSNVRRRMSADDLDQRK
jgi:hypothetical protein